MDEYEFRIDNSSLKGKYIGLSVEGEERTILCDSVINDQCEIEFYGAFSSEYGECIFGVRNKKGDSYCYSFSEDESVQEGFDSKEYEEKFLKSKNKILTIIPNELITNSPPITPLMPGNRAGDCDFNWNEYDPGIHSKKLELLRKNLESMAHLLSKNNLEGTKMFLLQHTNIDAADEEKLESSAKHFNEKTAGKYIVMLRFCLTRLPHSVIGGVEFQFLGPDEFQDLPGYISEPSFYLRLEENRFYIE